MAKLMTGDIAIGFTLPATDGQSYNVPQIFKDAKAVALVFTCNHCPYAQAWEDRINALARSYAPQGVRLLAISSNDAQAYPADSFANMTRRAQTKDFAFPYLYDEDQSVARAYGAERTPEFFIFDASAKLRYHGAPDDNYEDEQGVKKHYAREALDAILANKEVAIPETQPVGCTIKWKKA